GLRRRQHGQFGRRRHHAPADAWIPSVGRHGPAALVDFDTGPGKRIVAMSLSLPDRLDAGLPYPLGAHSDGLGVNFAVFSAHATKIELCIFDPRGRRELRRYTLNECTDEIWHGYLHNAEPGLLYGYRA